jgi:hypothetical protein
MNLTSPVDYHPGLIVIREILKKNTGIVTYPPLPGDRG